MANFDIEFDKLIFTEGGYVNDPDDAGGETYLGISRKHNPKWDGWKKIDSFKYISNSSTLLFNNCLAFNLSVASISKTSKPSTSLIEFTLNENGGSKNSFSCVSSIYIIPRFSNKSTGIAGSFLSNTFLYTIGILSVTTSLSVKVPPELPKETKLS